MHHIASLYEKFAKKYKATVRFNIQTKKIRDDINGVVFILHFFLEIF